MTDFNNIGINQVTFCRYDDDGNALKDEHGKRKLYYTEEDYDFLLDQLLDQLTIDDLKEL